MEEKRKAVAGWFGIGYGVNKYKVTRWRWECSVDLLHMYTHG